METARVPLAEAKTKLSAVVDDVRRTARRYIVVRHGRPAAAIVSVEDLDRLESSDRPDDHAGGALALLGLWADVGDERIDELFGEVMRSRAKDKGRKVELEP